MRCLAFWLEMEFRTLTSRIAAKLGVEAPAIEVKTEERPDVGIDQSLTAPIDHAKYETVRDAAGLDRWIAKIYDCGFVSVDTENHQP